MTDEPHALSACIGLPCRTAGKFLEVLSLILSMIVEIVARPSSAVMISVNSISISSVSTSAPGFDKHRLIFQSDLQFRANC